MLEYNLVFPALLPSGKNINLVFGCFIVKHLTNSRVELQPYGSWSFSKL